MIARPYHKGNGNSDCNGKQKSLFVLLTLITNCDSALLMKRYHGNLLNSLQPLLVLLTFFIVLTGCTTEPQKEVQVNQPNNQFTTVSAQKALQIAERLMQSDSVSMADWDDLFQSVGYRNYLIYSDSLAKRQLIQNAIQTVFDPGRQDELDSLLSIPLQMDANYFRLSLVNNFASLKANLDEAKALLTNTDFTTLIKSGDSLASTYLPKEIQDSLPELYDIHMIMSDPDAKVMENAIVFDLNMAVDRGVDNLVKIIAHEYHHNYRKLTAKKYEHPLMIQLNKIHQEGVADIIDKDEPPLSELGLYPKRVIDAYNADYALTPQKLEELDALTNAFLKQELDTAAYFDKLNNFFGFGGHTAGIYMSFKLAKAKTNAPLIESYNDPVKFIRMYNDWAADSPDEHVFSSEFMNYIELLEGQ